MTAVQAESPPFLVAAFYAFTSVSPADLESLLTDLPSLARREHVVGSVLLAPEGVNGTISGPDQGVAEILECLRATLTLGSAHFERLQVKRSRTRRPAFRRFKARRKREIVSLGQPCADPRRTVGLYVEPCDWNELVDDPETLVIDTRNAYEVAVGSFVGSLDPGTESFRDFPDWVEQRLRPLVEQTSPARIAMFCTGGIRCEKASSFLQQRGFPEVHHLQGGILNYLEQIPEEQSRWRGECFVFDQRVALNHRLEQGEHRRRSNLISRDSVVLKQVVFPGPESFVVRAGRATACPGAVLEEPEGQDAVEVLAVDCDIAGVGLAGRPSPP